MKLNALPPNRGHTEVRQDWFWCAKIIENIHKSIDFLKCTLLRHSTRPQGCSFKNTYTHFLKKAHLCRYILIAISDGSPAQVRLQLDAQPVLDMWALILQLRAQGSSRTLQYNILLHRCSVISEEVYFACFALAFG